jgi:hypothetical protein
MTKNEWSVDHMDWCGMDTDHSGNCAPRMDDDGTRPEKPPVDTDGRGNEIRHADVWDDETVPYVLADDEDYSLEAAIDYFTDTCSVVDEAHAVFCDLSYPHENEWHSGTDGVRRYSWPTVYRVPGHDYKLDGTHYMWECDVCLEETTLPTLPMGWDWYDSSRGVAWNPESGQVSATVASKPNESGTLHKIPESLPWDGSHTADEVLTNWHERGECGGSCRLCLNLANIKAAMIEAEERENPMMWVECNAVYYDLTECADGGSMCQHETGYHVIPYAVHEAKQKCNRWAGHVGEHTYIPGADTVPCGESLSETTQEGTEALKRQALTDTVREAIVALSTLLEEIA